MRSDKDWQTATTLEELRNLYKTSKEKTDVSLLNKLAECASECNASPVKKKIKVSPKKNKIDSFLVKTEPSDEKKPNNISKTNNILPNKNKINMNPSDSSSNTSFGVTDSSIKQEKTTKKRKLEIYDSDTSETDMRLISPKKEKTDQFQPEKKNKIKTNSSDSSSNTSFDDTDSPIKKKEISKKKKLQMSDSDTSETDMKLISPKEKKTRWHYPEKKNKIKMNSSDSTGNTSFNDTDSSIKKEKTTKKRKLEMNDSNTSETNMKLVSPKNGKTTQLHPENPLPDVFKDKRLGFYPDFISFPENERKHFERHWIAYGGVVVKSVRSTDVDFVVHNDNCIVLEKMEKLKRKLGSNVQHVNKSWLIKCINEVKLFDTAKFYVFLEP